MNHLRPITCTPLKAAAAGVGTYMVVAGQIIALLAELFADKEIFAPEGEIEGEGENA
ncbi:MAG TPA: hypothetical protein PLL36_08075 [Candidatus Hydrogenedentes bacterium]|nr:hypothetical protein [Candidatus Hydrogenedentota bacterium]